MKLFEITDEYVIDIGKLSERRVARLIAEQTGISLVETAELEQYQAFFNDFAQRSITSQDLQISKHYFPIEITASPKQKIISFYVVSYPIKFQMMTESQIIFKNDNQEKAVAFPNNLLDSDEHAVWIFQDKHILDQLVVYASTAFKNNWTLSFMAYDEKGQIRNTTLSGELPHN